MLVITQHYYDSSTYPAFHVSSDTCKGIQYWSWLACLLSFMSNFCFYFLDKVDNFSYLILSLKTYISNISNNIILFHLHWKVYKICLKIGKYTKIKKNILFNLVVSGCFRTFRICHKIIFCLKKKEDRCWIVVLVFSFAKEHWSSEILVLPAQALKTRWASKTIFLTKM